MQKNKRTLWTVYAVTCQMRCLFIGGTVMQHRARWRSKVVDGSRKVAPSVASPGFWLRRGMAVELSVVLHVPFSIRKKIEVFLYSLIFTYHLLINLY